MTQHSVCHSVSISQDVQSIGTGDHKAVLCDIALIEFYDVTVRDAYCFILHLLLPTISAHTSNAPFLHALPRINASVCIYSLPLLKTVFSFNFFHIRTYLKLSPPIPPADIVLVIPPPLVCTHIQPHTLLHFLFVLQVLVLLRTFVCSGLPMKTICRFIGRSTCH